MKERTFRSHQFILSLWICVLLLMGSGTPVLGEQSFAQESSAHPSMSGHESNTLHITFGSKESEVTLSEPQEVEIDASPPPGIVETPPPENPIPTPEPASLGLAILGLAGVVIIRILRQRRSR